MTKNTKKARFFCEYCDHEVKDDAKFCPYCGRFFASVRCPNCGYTGNHGEFSDGCPKCGYAMNGSSVKNELNKKKKKEYKNNSIKKEHHEDALPFWIYLFSIALLIVLLLIIFQYM